MKSGFAVLVGRSNAGKSSLINTLVGTKVAITSPKPQTTRHSIHGVLNDERGQIVFVDTPGVFTEAHDHITKTLLKTAEEATRDIDVLVYVADPTRAIGNEERVALRMVDGVKKPKILVLNKADVKKPPYKDEYLELAEKFDAVVEVSAKFNKNLQELKDKVMDFLPEGEPYYPPGQVSNLEQKQWLSELIREKIFLQTHQEVPYNAAVEIEELSERENGMVYIKANILTTADRYKKILVGAHGRRVKKIGQATRRELEAIWGKRVFLDLEVTVEEKWPERLFY